MLCTENKTCAKWWLKVMTITFITFNFVTSYFRYTSFFWIFSKDEILLVAFEHNKIFHCFISIANDPFYMFRLLYLTFFKEFRGTAEQKSHLHESPALITFPLIVLAVLATLGD
jgi:NADH-quinone oxidoreductase subunit L